jgi:putative addiction module killer protein
MRYKQRMRYEIEKTVVFDNWLKNLKDRQAVLMISMRLTRVALGNFGDTKSVGSGVYELRLLTGPGYRIYYTIKNGAIVLLLVGGDKSSQERDISKSKELARTLR